MIFIILFNLYFSTFYNTIEHFNNININELNQLITSDINKVKENIVKNRESFTILPQILDEFDIIKSTFVSQFNDSSLNYYNWYKENSSDIKNTFNTINNQINNYKYKMSTNIKDGISKYHDKVLHSESNNNNNDKMSTNIKDGISKYHDEVLHSASNNNNLTQNLSYHNNFKGI